MNGARTTFMRRGYLLTALSALLLLAASAGTAWAQDVLSGLEVTLTGPQRVTEGGDVTIQVSGEATIAAGTATSQRVTIGLSLAGTTAPGDRTTAAPGVTAEIDQAGQVNDVTITSNPTVTLEFAANSGSEDRTRRANATVTVRTNHDVDAENELVRIAAGQPSFGGTPLAGAYPPATAGGDREDTGGIGFQIADDETQGYALTLARSHSAPGSEPKEGGGTVTVDIKADPPHYDDGATFALGLYDSNGKSVVTPQGYAFPEDGNTVQVGETDTDRTNDVANMGTITFTPPDNDGNRVTDVITLEADAGAGRRFQQAVVSLAIDILDADLLPVATAVAKDKDGNEAMEIMEGGDPVYLTVTVDRREAARNRFTDEDLTVDIEPANAAQVSDYELSVTEVDFDQPNSRQDSDVDLEIMLSARSDEDVGAEDLVLNLVTSGDRKIGTETSVGTFSISIVDNTMKKVEPRSEDDAYGAIMDAIDEGAGDEGLNPGESFIVETSALFDVAEGYTASYGVSVEGDPAISVSSSTDSITVDAKSAGESKVTVTATAKMSSSSFMPEQTVSDVASITFPVTVVDKDLVVMLEMPDNVMEGNIVEGSSYDITVSANRTVTEDTEVMIMRDRAASDADDDDFTVSSATIMAGYDSATAELMVTEDMEDDAGHGMGEVLVLYGEVNGEETNSLTFTIWDEAVPALPLIAQLLLALFLMVGGSRLYRRRQG